MQYPQLMLEDTSRAKQCTHKLNIKATGMQFPLNRAG